MRGAPDAQREQVKDMLWAELTCESCELRAGEQSSVSDERPEIMSELRAEMDRRAVGGINR